MSIAVSIPSRVIISSVKRNTPANASAPVFSADCSRWSSMSRLMRFACRHMCTMSDANEHRSDEREHAFPQRLVRCALEQYARADAQTTDADAPVHGGDQPMPPLLRR